MSGPTTPTTTQFCTGTKFNTMQQSHQNTWGRKLETKHQTFINDCLSLSTIFHVFDWLNLVYLSDICSSSGIPLQNCCRECVMMPKLMTRTQYFWEFSQTQRSQYSGNCFGNFCYAPLAEGDRNEGMVPSSHWTTLFWHPRVCNRRLRSSGTTIDKVEDTM